MREDTVEAFAGLNTFGGSLTHTAVRPGCMDIMRKKLKFDHTFVTGTVRIHASVAQGCDKYIRLVSLDPRFHATVAQGSDK